MDEATVNLANYLTENLELDLASVAYILQRGRRAFDYRRMVVAETIEEAAKSLSANAPKNVFTALHSLGMISNFIR